MANDQGGFSSPHWWGMSASWLQRYDLDEDSHGDPDDTEHCFISFQYMSPWFSEYTNHLDYKFADFVCMFYYYATQGYTVDDALDQAALDCLGNDLQNTWVYKGYLRYFPAMGGTFECKIREFGDGGMTLT